MTPPRDWKWKLALGILVVFAAWVGFWPRSRPVSIAPAVSPAGAEGLAFPSNDIPLRYTVQENDTAEGISRLFVVSEADLRRANHLPANGKVKPGMQIWIPPQAL
jgi:hypothetical protein